MTMKDRAAAARRAKHALGHLEQHPGTGLDQLGAARTQLNIVHNLNDDQAIWGAVHALESVVVDVYGRIAACSTCT